MNEQEIGVLGGRTSPPGPVPVAGDDPRPDLPLGVALCVDLDGTLVKSDTLVDSLLVMARQRPGSILRLPIWLMQGKAAFKRHIAQTVTLDVEHLPWNRPLLEWLRAQHSLGHAIYLATASDHDIAERVSALRSKRVAANSVYRILDLFVRTNLARRVESANAYIANSHPGCRHDCIFLICDSCGRVVHIDDDRLTETLVQAARKSGFADVRPVIELRGQCARCS